MFVSLLGDRHPKHFIRGALLVATQTALAYGLFV
jgi:hypothetical protein